MFITIRELLLVLSITGVYADVTVNTKLGSIVGFEDVENSYIAFYGIPYAGNVSGNRRFTEAPPLDKLPDAFTANNRNILCAHPTPDGIVGQEDCLTLNVFTKNVTTVQPVFVWLNGEDYSQIIDRPFTFKSLVNSGSVVVTLNYRLSIFGFLCLGIEEAPGNVGLKDVIQGLRWLKSNIKSFGGDPNNIILIGHGSGAAMVDLITMSPSRDLVNKAIALSGSAIAPWAVAFEPVGYAKALGAAVNFKGYDSVKLAKYLLTIDKEHLATAINTFDFLNNSVLFAPCVENKTLPGSVLVEAPIDILKSGNYSKIPYIAGYVSNEGTLRVSQAIKGNWLEKMEKVFEDFLPVDLDLQGDTKGATAQQIKTYYFHSKEVNNESIEQFVDYEGETTITVPVIRSAFERTDRYKDVYLFRFHYEENATGWPYNVLKGTRHGRILDYIFDGDPNIPIEARNMLIKRLSAFAETGIPNDYDLTGWPQVGENRGYLKIAGIAPAKIAEASAEQPLKEIVKFWSDFHYLHPQGNWENSAADALSNDSSGLTRGLGIWTVLISLCMAWKILFVL